MYLWKYYLYLFYSQKIWIKDKINLKLCDFFLYFQFISALEQ